MLQNKYKTNSLMRCRYFSFAIPLGSILALLLVLTISIIVPSSKMVSALEISNSSMYDTNEANSANGSNSSSNPDSDDVSSSINNSATTYADNALSLSIGGAGQSEAVKTVAGEVAYRAHTVNVSATNMKTYAIMINGPVGLKNDTGNTTITGAGNTIPNGTGSTMMPTNSWGYAYGQTGDVANMTYSSFTNTTQTIDTANTTPNFTKNLVFAAKFGEDATIGHYTATVTLSITATPKVITNYTLSYNANGGSNAPSQQTYTDDTEAGNHIFTISSTKPTRSGYEFAGWSTTSTGTASYQPGGTITLQASNPSQTLYAVWKDARTITNITYMQDMTSDICANTSTGTTKTITDDRTYPSGVSNTYTIRKMEDGKCWMTQNLRLTGSSLTSSNSNVGTSYTIPTSSISSFNSLSATQAAYYYSATDTAYYTWCAATANTCGSFTTDGANSTYNICPQGWTLPTGGTGTSTGFRNLFTNMGLSITSSLQTTTGSVRWGTGDLAIVQGSKYNFANTGLISSGTLSSTGNGLWWSRTAGSSTNAYSLNISGNFVSPGTYYAGDRCNGFAVRCVAE